MTATIAQFNRPTDVESARLRVVIYTRVSSNPTTGAGRCRSRRLTVAPGARNGLDLVRVFSDNDRSASRYAAKDRPEYRELIQFIESGAADGHLTGGAHKPHR